jgi:hypothetical protein
MQNHVLLVKSYAIAHDRDIMREARSKNAPVFVPAVRQRFARQESSDEVDMADEKLCIQYNPDLLPPVKIDLDEIDDFLAHDIFVQESLTSTK